MIVDLLQTCVGAKEEQEKKNDKIFIKGEIVTLEIKLKLHKETDLVDSYKVQK